MKPSETIAAIAGKAIPKLSRRFPNDPSDRISETAVFAAKNGLIRLNEHGEVEFAESLKWMDPDAPLFATIPPNATDASKIAAADQMAKRLSPRLPPMEQIAAQPAPAFRSSVSAEDQAKIAAASALEDDLRAHLAGQRSGQ